VELQGRVKELQDKGLGLATISYDSREVIAAFAKQHVITFPMLSDPGSETIKRYGILNPVVAEAFGPNKDDPAVKADVQRYISVVNPTPNMQGIAFPGTFMLDRQGRVTSRFFEDFYIERNTVSSVMKRLGGGTAPVAGTKITTERLELTTYPSDAAIAPGNRFSIALDITPKRRMHVYAPGASGYRVVSVQIAAQPFIHMTAPQYPASETYHFKPLNERVPVYQKPFTMIQEIVLEGDLKAQAALRGKETLTINGSLDYQACDDKICYNPVSVPLTWTMNLRSLVLQRPTVAR
jgi:peroxiredoxin